MTAYITLSFDDGFKETIESVLPMLEKYGFKGSFNVIPGLVGKKLDVFKLSNWDELKNLARMKHEIASHTMTHAALLSGADLYLSRFSRFFNAITQSPYKLYHIKKSTRKFKKLDGFSRGSKVRKPYEADILYELVNSRVSIDRIIPYQTCTSFVYPGGAYCRKLEKEIERAGYSSARGMKFGYNKPGALSKTSLKVQTWHSFTRVSDMNRSVDRAVKKGLWLIECYHLIGKKQHANYDYFTNTLDFEKHLRYLMSLNKKGATMIDTQGNIIALLEVSNKRCLQKT